MTASWPAEAMQDLLSMCVAFLKGAKRARRGGGAEGVDRYAGRLGQYVKDRNGSSYS